MGSPLNLTAYPDWFMELARDFEGGVNSKTFILPDHKGAMRLRQQFYGFIRALKRDDSNSMFPRFTTIRIAIAENELTLQHVDSFIPKPPEKPNGLDQA